MISCCVPTCTFSCTLGIAADLSSSGYQSIKQEFATELIYQTTNSSTSTSRHQLWLVHNNFCHDEKLQGYNRSHLWNKINSLCANDIVSNNPNKISTFGVNNTLKHCCLNVFPSTFICLFEACVNGDLSMEKSLALFLSWCQEGVRQVCCDWIFFISHPVGGPSSYQ